MSENLTAKEQNIFLYGKNKLLVTGVASVDSFDENGISATTVEGDSVIAEGSGISITDVNLEKGQFEASGSFSGIFYAEHKAGTVSLFGRIFKAK